MYQLGILSDEVSADFERACRLIKGWDLQHVELRTMWGKNILDLSESELRQVAEILARYQLAVTAIASPIFKSPRDGQPKAVAGDFQLAGFESFAKQLELLERAAVLAKRFGTDKIRVFTFWREAWSEALLDDVSDKLLEAAALAKTLAVRLAVENEPVCIVGTGQELGALLAAIRAKAEPAVMKHIGVLWDPGNASHGGEERPYPDGYQQLKAAEIIHVHLKDALLDEEGQRQLVPLGEGIIDYHNHFIQLKKDGYDGVLVLEPHYHPEGMSQEDAALICVKAAKASLAKAFHAN
jgi:sugar phosphate isomerase/epimerase